MGKVKTLVEAQRLLAEYDALPDNLNVRLSWRGYERLPDYTFTCVCGYKFLSPMGLDDLRFMVNKGRFDIDHFKDICFGHDESEEEN